jgi:feruloyl esterase
MVKTTGVARALALLAAAFAARGTMAADLTPRGACDALAKLEIPAARIGLPTTGARVEASRLIAASDDGNPNGESCEVKGWIDPVSAGAPRMQFEVNLPSLWNRKLLQLGGAAYDGQLVTGLGPEGLQPKSLSCR